MSLYREANTSEYFSSISIQSLATPVPGKGLLERFRNKGKKSSSSSSGASNNDYTRNQNDALNNHDNFFQLAKTAIESAGAAKINALDLAIGLRNAGHFVSPTVEDGNNQAYIDSVAALQGEHANQLLSLKQITLAHEEALEGTNKLREAQDIRMYTDMAYDWMLEHPEDNNNQNYMNESELKRYKNRIQESLRSFNGHFTEDYDSGSDGRHSD